MSIQMLPMKKTTSQRRELDANDVAGSYLGSFENLQTVGLLSTHFKMRMSQIIETN